MRNESKREAGPNHGSISKSKSLNLLLNHRFKLSLNSSIADHKRKIKRLFEKNGKYRKWKDSYMICM